MCDNNGNKKTITLQRKEMPERRYKNQNETTTKKKKKKKKRKKERQKIGETNSEVVRFEPAPPEKDAKHSRNSNPNRLSNY